MSTRSRRGDRSDEAIPATMYRLNVAGRCGIIAQRFTQLADTSLEHGIPNESAGPDRFQQFVRTDKLALALRENFQDRERLRSKSDCPRPLPQAFIRKVELKLSKSDVFHNCAAEKQKAGELKAKDAGRSALVAKYFSSSQVGNARHQTYTRLKITATSPFRHDSHSSTPLGWERNEGIAAHKRIRDPVSRWC